LLLSKEAKLVSGITVLVIPTIMYGGWTLLGILTQGSAVPMPGDLKLDDNQWALWRAGHAHAGVWTILSLLLQLLLDSTRLTSSLRWLARVAAPVAAVALSGGFFGLAFSVSFRWLIYVGALAMLADAPRPLLAVILGSSWPSRIYFPETTAAVIRRLSLSDGDSPALFPVLLGGPDETKLAGEVMRHLDGVAALNLAGRTSLRDLIAIFPECAVAFGPDSGPMHIAAAVGCPVISLWGATAAERSAPWGFADLAISGAIPCHPCYLRKCPIGRECMRRISPELVSLTVRRAFAIREASR